METRVLNQAVRRNLVRFPEDFMFPLSRNEVRNISQSVICSTLKHARNVFGFTEQGVAMLSSVLNRPRAIQVNIEIMRAFVRLCQVTAANQALAQKFAELERKVAGHNQGIQARRSSVRGSSHLWFSMCPSAKETECSHCDSQRGCCRPEPADRCEPYV